MAEDFGDAPGLGNAADRPVRRLRLEDFADRTQPGIVEMPEKRLEQPADHRSIAIDAKASIEIAREYLVLVDDVRLWEPIAEEHARTVAAVLEIVEADELLDRHPVVQRSIRLRNPYVDPMSAIQVELLRRYRNGDDAVVPPLLRSIAGIAAGLRNTG